MKIVIFHRTLLLRASFSLFQAVWAEVQASLHVPNTNASAATTISSQDPCLIPRPFLSERNSDLLPGTFIVTGLEATSAFLDYLTECPSTHVKRLLISDSTEEDLLTDFGGYLSVHNYSDPLEVEHVRHHNHLLDIDWVQKNPGREDAVISILDRVSPSLEALSYLMYKEEKEEYDYYLRRKKGLFERTFPVLSELTVADALRYNHEVLCNHDTLFGWPDQLRQYPLTHIHVIPLTFGGCSSIFGSSGFVQNLPHLTNLRMSGVTSVEVEGDRICSPASVHREVTESHERISRNISVIVQPGFPWRELDLDRDIDDEDAIEWFMESYHEQFVEPYRTCLNELRRDERIVVKPPNQDAYATYRNHGAALFPLPEAIETFIDRSKGGPGEWEIPILPKDRLSWWENDSTLRECSLKPLRFSPPDRLSETSSSANEEQKKHSHGSEDDNGIFLSSENSNLPVDSFAVTGIRSLEAFVSYIARFPDVHVKRLLLCDLSLVDINKNFGRKVVQNRSNDYEAENVRHHNTLLDISWRKLNEDWSKHAGQLLQAIAPKLESLSFLMYHPTSSDALLRSLEFPVLSELTFAIAHGDICRDYWNNYPLGNPPLVRVHMASYEGCYGFFSRYGYLKKSSSLTHVRLSGSISVLPSLESEAVDRHISRMTSLLACPRFPYFYNLQDFKRCRDEPAPPISPIPPNMTLIVQPGTLTVKHVVSVVAPGIHIPKNNLIVKQRDSCDFRKEVMALLKRDDLHLQFPDFDDFQRYPEFGGIFPLPKALDAFIDRANGGEGEWSISTQISDEWTRLEEKAQNDCPDVDDSQEMRAISWPRSAYYELYGEPYCNESFCQTP